MVEKFPVDGTWFASGVAAILGLVTLLLLITYGFVGVVVGLCTLFLAACIIITNYGVWYNNRLDKELQQEKQP